MGIIFVTPIHTRLGWQRVQSHVQLTGETKKELFCPGSDFGAIMAILMKGRVHEEFRSEAEERRNNKGRVPRSNDGTTRVRCHVPMTWRIQASLIQAQPR